MMLLRSLVGVGPALTRHGCRCMCTDSVRVRFAPSPTGQLHLGGLRTALYNYLYARSHGGTFILRVEDTDQGRFVPVAVDKIVEMLNWAGMEIDEGPFQGGPKGPYQQSERLELYQEMIKVLLQNGTAYHCFCTANRLELLRKDAARRRETPKYDNRCRHLSSQEIQDKLAAGLPYVIRFKLDHTTDPWPDLVYGDITHDVAEAEGDPVLLKSDGFPTYHFANVVDDHLMNITHVLRGIEWQLSTPKHLLLYKAFGWQPPQYAHLPLLLNKDGTKLSKRQNDIHVEHLKNKGYFPEAVLNLLTLVGSGFKVASTEGLTLPELVEQFDLIKLKTNSTRIELDRLGDLNHKHIVRILENGQQDKADIIHQVQVLVSNYHQQRSHDLTVHESILSEAYITHVLEWAKDRIEKLEDLFNPELEFLWRLPSSSHIEDLLTVSTQALDLVHLTLCIVKDCDSQQFHRDYLVKNLKQLGKAHSVKFPVLMKLLRGALSGLKEGPPVAEIMTVLGQDVTEHRLTFVLNQLEKLQKASEQLL